MFKILDKQGGEVTAEQQAVFNKISTNSSSGYVDGFLNNFRIAKLSSNMISIDSGILSIQGFRIVNDTLETFTVNVTPSQPIVLQLVAIYSHFISNENDSVEIVTRPLRELRQEALFQGQDAVYELELAEFSMTKDGIADFTVTLERLVYNEQDIDELLDKVKKAETDSAFAVEKVNDLETKIIEKQGTVIKQAGNILADLEIAGYRLTNENIDDFRGVDYWGKTFYAAGGNTVTGKPPNTGGFYLEVLRGGSSSTIHRYTAVSDSSGESISPNIYQRQYVSYWTNWEELVSADGSYPTLGAGYLAKNVQIAASASQSSVGWWKVGSIDLSAIGKSSVSSSTVILVTGLYTHITETGLLEVNGRLQDGVLNPTASPVYLTFGNLETNDFCVAYEGTVITLYTYITNVYIRSSFTIIQDATEISSNTNYFTFSPSYYGSTAPDGAVYAVLRNNASDSENLGGKPADSYYNAENLPYKNSKTVFNVDDFASNAKVGAYTYCVASWGGNTYYISGIITSLASGLVYITGSVTTSTGAYDNGSTSIAINPTADTVSRAVICW